jgi:hypothetical protein
VLQQNIFIEQSIVKGTMRPFTDDEMAEYRRPFLEPGEGRRPMLTWPRQLPIGGEPADVVEIVDAYAAWLSTSAIPKLYIRAEPGTHSEKMIEQVRTWPNQQEVAVRGIHYPQEDAPDEIGVAIATWLNDDTGRRAIEVDYELTASPEKVWRALTEPELLARWLMPNDIAPIVGHSFTFRTDPAPGFDGLVHCQVEVAQAPTRLVYSWRGGPIDTIVTWTLTLTS